MAALLIGHVDPLYVSSSRLALDALDRRLLVRNSRGAVLSATKLAGGLAVFTDRRGAAFAGFPMTRGRTRQRRAEVFFLYISDMLAIGPVAIVPDDTSALFSAVEAAFTRTAPVRFRPWRHA